MKKQQRKRLLLANLLHIFGLSVLAPIYALFGLTVGANAWQIGASWGLYNLVGGISTIVIGRFIDGFKRDRLFVIIGYLITIVGISFFFFVSNPTQLYLVLTINAVGLGFYMPAWKSLYTKAETKGKLASQWGVFDGTNMIAMALAATLAGYLANTQRYNYIFVIIIIFYSLATLVALSINKH